MSLKIIEKHMHLSLISLSRIILTSNIQILVFGILFSDMLCPETIPLSFCYFTLNSSKSTQEQEQKDAENLCSFYAEEKTTRSFEYKSNVPFRYVKLTL